MFLKWGTEFFFKKSPNMKRRISVIIAGLLFHCCLNAQGLTKVDQHKIDSLIDNYFHYSGFEHSSKEIAFGYGPSSFFILILNLDSVGRVNKVKLMSDCTYKDSIFAIFSRLNPEIFKVFQSLENARKTIIIPLAYAAPHGVPTYVKDIAENAIQPGVFGNTIVLPKLVFGWGRWRRFMEPLKTSKPNF